MRVIEDFAVSLLLKHCILIYSFPFSLMWVQQKARLMPVPAWGEGARPRCPHGSVLWQRGWLSVLPRHRSEPRGVEPAGGFFHPSPIFTAEVVGTAGPPLVLPSAG